MPSGSVASAMNLANEVQKTNSEMHLSLAALNVAALLPPARVVDRRSTVAQSTVSSGRLDISGAQVLIGFCSFCASWGCSLWGLCDFGSSRDDKNEVT